MKIYNKKAYFKYIILDKFEAGVVLGGAEVKAFRTGAVNITEAFIKIINGELFLINALIQSRPKSTDPTRRRKLLMHKKQTEKLQSLIKTKKLTLIPLSMYTKAHFIKVEVALVKAKKDYQKKDVLKKRDLKRQIERELLDKNN